MARHQKLCPEVNIRAPSFLESGEWTDCKFVVGAEPHQVVVGGYKLVMAMASPVFEAMFYGSLAETTDHIRIVDVEPEIFKAMLQYIYTGNVQLSSCREATQLCYTAKKYLLHHLADECFNYLGINVNVGNVCQLYEFSQLFEDEILKQKCINLFTEKTKELLQDNSFKDAALSTVEKIFSLDELNIDSEVDLINAAALYASAQVDEPVTTASGDGSHAISCDDISMTNVNNNLEGAFGAKTACEGPQQTTPGPFKKMKSDNGPVAVDQGEIRTVVKHIRFLTLTAQQYTECTARYSLLTLPEDHAIILNILSDKSSVAMPNGLSTCRVHRKKEVDRGRSEATFRFSVHNISRLKGEELSSEFYVRNLPWQIKVMPRSTLSNRTTSLGFFVQCITHSRSKNWSCNANIVLRLKKRDDEWFTRTTQHLYTTLEDDWGYSHFLPMETVLDPAEGYVRDDAITVEVQLTADEPQGVL